ncbi:Flp family type IVb pilin [Pseudomonas viridiflava]|jgi:pilus assembly protein Flp/PilA|uniref:Flp family type IVb pilin n=1 Tax=Pseudomonas viridiflava TaxID=33069 RepID=UPI000F068A32|nr:Flp family type IVb pilin [Pseudomonas viridiflava]
MSPSLKKFLADESGVTAIEYGILAAAMAAAIGVIFGSDGVFVTALKDRFASIADQITNTNTPGASK